jgi:flagellar biosynthesis protein FliQ
MTASQVLDITRDALWVSLVASAPIIVVVMIVGIMISLLQALTQVQEMTLTFVPKILAAVVTTIVAAPFIGTTITDFAQRTYLQIEQPDAVGPVDTRRRPRP